MKKEAKTYSSSIPIDMFYTGVVVIIAESAEDLHRDIEDIVKEYYEEGSPSFQEDVEGIRENISIKGVLMPGMTLSHQRSDGSQGVYVVFQGTPKSLRTEVIVHEMYHAMRDICRDRGVEDDETEAYMVEFLCHNMFEQLKCFNKPDKKVKKKD